MNEKQFIFATNEKRFNLDDESRIWDNGTPMTALDIVMMLNEQQSIISELKKENKGLKEKLDDVLELTEFVGMTSLRKAEIKSIVNR